jgi:hypothetical protein
VSGWCISTRAIACRNQALALCVLFAFDFVFSFEFQINSPTFAPPLPITNDSLAYRSLPIDRQLDRYFYDNFSGHYRFVFCDIVRNRASFIDFAYRSLSIPSFTIDNQRLPMIGKIIAQTR